jgi:hypothetical protein
MTYPDSELDLETPEVDAAEQARRAGPDWRDDDGDNRPVSSSFDAPEWDAQEQGREIELDDDYR